MKAELSIVKRVIRVFVPALFVFIAVSSNAQQKPNIILILSDDAGYADFSFQSDRFIATPNIDRIAKEGAHFTNAYVTAAVCAPSRAGLLTGINQAEFGNVGNFVQGVKYNIPKDSFGIPRPVKLVGDYLKPLGYRTGIIGKWHEGFSKDYHPNQRGFDYFWGFLWGSSNYTTGKATMVEENGKPVDPNSIPYMTDAITDRAINFINEEKEAPFFLYVSYNAVHTPLQAKQEDVDKFKEKYGDDRKRLMNAAMTHNLDQNVGRILGELEKLGLLKNTMVIFANDNGGQETTLHADNYPLRGMKGDIWEGGIRVPMAVRWEGHIRSDSEIGVPVSSLDFIPTFLAAAGIDPKSSPQLKGLNLVKLSADAKYAAAQKNRVLYWKLGKDKGAIRRGDWKLVYEPGKMPALVNLKEDIGEEKEFSGTQKKIVSELSGLYKKWLATLPPERFYPVDKKNEGAD